MIWDTLKYIKSFLKAFKGEEVGETPRGLKRRKPIGTTLQRR